MGDITALTQLDYTVIFLGIFVLLLGAQAILKLGDYFCTRFGIETKKMRERREDHELLIKTSQNLSLLQEKHECDTEISNKHDKELDEKITTFMTEVKYEINKLVTDRLYDRENTRETKAECNGIQNKIFETLNEMSDKIDSMKQETDERFAISEEKQNKRVQSEIKERIAQSYRRYNLSGKITHMELESLEDLISTYEDHGGDNSFVHSVVQKEMYTWEVIE